MHQWIQFMNKKYNTPMDTIYKQGML